jgi:Response regulator receiver domain
MTECSNFGDAPQSSADLVIARRDPLQRRAEARAYPGPPYSCYLQCAQLPARDPTWMPLRCLIVDDNASFLDAAAGLLEREGMAIAGVASAAEALRKAGELRPDIVLVDIMLGRESGIDLAHRLARPTRPVPPSS